MFMVLGQFSLQRPIVLVFLSTTFQCWPDEEVSFLISPIFRAIKLQKHNSLSRYVLRSKENWKMLWLMRSQITVLIKLIH